MKKAVPYVIIPALLIALFVFFLTSKLWLPDDRKNETVRYNQELVLGDHYLKFSDAVYDSYKKEYKISLYFGSKKETPSPMTFAVYSENNKSSELSYKLIRLDTPEPLYEMVISDVPESYYYLSIEARTLVDFQSATLGIQIDYRDATVIDSSKMIYVYVTPTPSPSLTPTPFPDPTAEFEAF